MSIYYRYTKIAYRYVRKILNGHTILLFTFCFYFQLNSMPAFAYYHVKTTIDCNQGAVRAVRYNGEPRGMLNYFKNSKIECLTLNYNISCNFLS